MSIIAVAHRARLIDIRNSRTACIKPGAPQDRLVFFTEKLLLTSLKDILNHFSLDTLRGLV